MTIPMDNSSDQLSRERIQRLFNKNVELENKRKKAAQARIPSDPNIWQLMRENYETIILEDHSFSEQHEVEYALWQLHYRRIEELRALLNASVASVASATSAAAQNAKGPPRGIPDRTTKIRAQFKAFLSEATGFYHDLMVKIRAKYGLPLGSFMDAPDNRLSLSKDGVKLTELKKGLISCQRCLIYLGDLARYKGLYGEGESKARDFTAASSYYMQASSLWPSSGNPHHQLAIIASYSGDEVVAIYRYFRSLAVDSPFVTARDNLIIAFEKNRQSYSQLLGEVKTPAASTRSSAKGRGKSESRMPLKDNLGNVNSVKERGSDLFKSFGTRFVRLNGILFTRTSLETFGEVLSTVRKDMVDILSSGPDEVFSFGSDVAECRLMAVRLVATLIFTVHNVNKETENQSYAEILQRSALLQNAFAATFDIVGLLLERCMQLSDPSVSYLLPGIMVFIEWLACHHDIAVGSELDEKQASTRLYFWNQCIPFLNMVLACGSAFLEKDEDETCFFNMTTYEEGETANRLALSEDFELRGFLPLVPAQLILDFSRKQSFGSDGSNKEKKVRIQRIIAAGKALANVVKVGEVGVYFDGNSKKFIIGSEPPAVDDYSLTNSPDVPKLSNIEQANTVFSDLGVGSFAPNPQYMESEEEDEVIVFKPSKTEKHVDGPTLNMTSSDGLAHLVDAAKVNPRKENGFLSAGLDAPHVHSYPNTNIKPPASAGQVNVDHLQPYYSGTSTWMAAEQAPLVNSLYNMNLMEQGLKLKYESQNYLGVKSPADFSVPLPQSAGPGICNQSVQISETVVPSKLDSVMSSGGDAKGSSYTSTGLKKNPVSRPIRHNGPPPGFGSVAPKLDDSMLAKNDNSYVQPMDDYRWLDGYQFPTSNLSNGIDKSLESSVHSYTSMSKGSSSIGMLNFPFPGKQMPTMQVQMENSNGWPEYQLSIQSKLQEQQQQLQRQNQQSAAMPQQYQGQSLWEGHSLV